MGWPRWLLRNSMIAALLPGWRREKAASRQPPSRRALLSALAGAVLLVEAPPGASAGGRRRIRTAGAAGQTDRQANGKCQDLAPAQALRQRRRPKIALSCHVRSPMRLSDLA